MLLPVNDLERKLHKAAADGNEAPRFYEALMESSVYVLGRPEDDAEGKFTLGDEQALIIQHWERETDKSPVIPFFTSLQMLQQAIDTDEPYLELPVTALFQMTMGAPLVLNPNSEFGMEFEPDEVAALLETDLMDHSEHRLDEKTEVLLGIPEKRPHALIKALSNYFSQLPNIDAAYLGTIQIPADDDSEHLMVGIRGSGEFGKIIDTAIKKISVIDDLLDHEIVDFYVIDQDDQDISDFMVENIEPFYSARLETVH